MIVNGLIIKLQKFCAVAHILCAAQLHNLFGVTRIVSNGNKESAEKVGNMTYYSVDI